MAAAAGAKEVLGPRVGEAVDDVEVAPRQSPRSAAREGLDSDRLPSAGRRNPLGRDRGPRIDLAREHRHVRSLSSQFVRDLPGDILDSTTGGQEPFDHECDAQDGFLG